MALLTSSRRPSISSSSTSSFRSTAQHSNLYRAEESMDPLFGTYLDPPPADQLSLHTEEGPGGPKCSSPYSWHNRSSFGNSISLGSSLMGRPSSISSNSAGAGGGVLCHGESYSVSVDVSQFEPQDVVVMAYHQHIVIQAAKILDGGRVGDTFTHNSLLPEDMDPLSVSGRVSSDGVLVVSVQRNVSQTEPPGPCSA
ncbi:unnamed protein product [Knipowitschia caucasica]|uniref:SHSP domain-containing protein n=1 Tax=Knipowitschia caucasica TaxID=637954 RepID=A0AAV2J1Q4_KNICA